MTGKRPTLSLAVKSLLVGQAFLAYGTPRSERLQTLSTTRPLGQRSPNLSDDALSLPPPRAHPYTITKSVSSLRLGGGHLA